MKKLRVGIIGCGTIGSEVAKACVDRLRDKVELVGLCDTDSQKAESLQKALKSATPILPLDGLLEKAELAIEAASAKISADVLEKAIKAKRDVFIMSVGGLLGKEDLLKRARAAGTKVYLPSGALCGIDGLKSASIGRIDSVTLTTRKPPKGLEGAPYLKEKGIDVMAVKTETIIFEGDGLEAIKGFPANVNVCAVLSLAGIGGNKTRVRIVTSPEYTKNIHEVEIVGEFGRISTKTENVPSKTNPKTSQLAVFSAIATLEAIADTVRIGT